MRFLNSISFFIFSLALMFPRNEPTHNSFRARRVDEHESQLNPPTRTTETPDSSSHQTADSAANYTSGTDPTTASSNRSRTQDPPVHYYSVLRLA